MEQTKPSPSVTWVVDRIEGDFAVIDWDKGRIDIPLAALPEGTREGSVLRIALDPEEETRRKNRIRSLFDRLRVD